MRALSATDPRFLRAYKKAQVALLDAVNVFEQETGRKVDGIALRKLNVTRMQDEMDQFVMTAEVSFLPITGELS